jgi:hypothetical protein
MIDEAKQIVVTKTQGRWDTIAASLRLMAIVASTAPAAALLVRKGDLIGLYDYFHSEPGVALLAALGGLASGGFAIYKSWKRGTQLASVASDHRVPDSVATTNG